MQDISKHFQTESEVAPPEFSNWGFVDGFRSHVDIIPEEAPWYEENFKPGIRLVYKCGEDRITGEITLVENPVKVYNLYRFHYYVTFTNR